MLYVLQWPDCWMHENLCDVMLQPGSLLRQQHLAMMWQPWQVSFCAASFSASIAVTTPTGHLSPAMSQYRDRAWATFPIQLYLKLSKWLKILKICSIYPLLQLITPCLSNRWITLWMEIRVSWLMQYYHQSTTEVMISTWYSSTISNRRVLWETGQGRQLFNYLCLQRTCQKLVSTLLGL